RPNQTSQGPSQLLCVHPRWSEVGRSDHVLVVLEMDQVPTSVAADELLRDHPDVLARRPRVDQRGSLAGREDLHSAAYPGEIERSEPRLADVVGGRGASRNADRCVDAEPGELVREIEDVDRAVRAEVVVVDEED